MKIHSLCIIIAMVGNLSAQVLDQPRFLHERLSWGMTVSQMLVQCRGKDPKIVPIDDRNPFAKDVKDIIAFSYTDVLESEKIGISIMFNTKDSTLDSFSVIYIGIDSVNHELLPDVEQRQKRLLKVLTSHFPGTPNERSIPFMGTVFTWKLPHVTVTAMNTSKSLVIIYRRPQ